MKPKYMISDLYMKFDKNYSFSINELNYNDDWIDEEIHSPYYYDGIIYIHII